MEDDFNEDLDNAFYREELLEEKVQELEKENAKLKARVKRLEKRVAKLKKRDETLAEEILELDAEKACDIPIYEKKIEGRCPKCGSKLEELPIPGKTMHLCTRCDFREVV